MPNYSDWAELDLDRSIDPNSVEVKLSEIWDWVKLGQRVSSESGLILLQNRADFHDIIKAMSADPRTANRRAMRVTRHLNKVIDHLDGAKVEFGKIPAAIKSTFDVEIGAQRQTKRRKVDFSG